MKSYVAVTGVLFALLVVVHVWRFVVERSVGTDPFFITVTLVSSALALWAARLVARSARP
jgi:hypothetical protein